MTWQKFVFFERVKDLATTNLIQSEHPDTSLMLSKEALEARRGAFRR